MDQKEKERQEDIRNTILSHNRNPRLKIRDHTFKDPQFVGQVNSFGNDEISLGTEAPVQQKSLKLKPIQKDTKTQSILKSSGTISPIALSASKASQARLKRLGKQSHARPKSAMGRLGISSNLNSSSNSLYSARNRKNQTIDEKKSKSPIQCNASVSDEKIFESVAKQENETKEKTAYVLDSQEKTQESTRKTRKSNKHFFEEEIRAIDKIRAELWG